MNNQNRKQVVLEMCTQRGYTNIEVNYNTSVEDGHDGHDIYCIDNEGNDTYVKFLLHKLKLPQHFKKYMESFQNPKSLHHIIILCKKPSTLFKKLCEPFHIELFYKEELDVNITKHVLVPKHVLIPQTNVDKIENICKKYNIESKTTLPIMLSTDPVCKFYGGKVGDIFEIYRNSSVSGNYVSYRYVDTEC